MHRWSRPALLAAGLLVAAGSLDAQFPPDSLTNVQVFPKDTPVRQLIGTMRTFALGLGVRCEYCHVGEGHLPLDSFDFASDEKRTKRIAREMIKMVRDINQQQLAALEERREPNVIVECRTCHRGIARPVPIEAVLQLALAEGGVDSARAAYRSLRERYRDRGSYDFSEGPLVDVATNLVQEQRGEAAIPLLALNLEFHERPLRTHVTLGEIYRSRADTAAALASYRAALNIDGSLGFVRQRIAELTPK